MCGKTYYDDSKVMADAALVVAYIVETGVASGDYGGDSY